MRLWSNLYLVNWDSSWRLGRLKETPMGNTSPRITSAAILPSDIKASPARYLAEVMAEFGNGTTDVVLRYYDDELSFGEHEFVGKTQEQVNEMFHQRDVAYLQS